jgi:hypothetical protein
MKVSRTLIILASVLASFAMLTSAAAPVWAQPSPPSDPSAPWTPPEEEDGEVTMPAGVDLSLSTSVPPPPPGTGAAISTAYLRDNMGQAKNQFVGNEVFFLVMQVNMPGRFYLYEYYPPGNVPQGHWLIYNSRISNGGTWTIGPFYPEPMEPEGQHVWRLWFWGGGGGRWAEYLVRWNYYSREEQKFPVINSFTASPGKIQSGDSATLSWNVTNATTVTIDPGLGGVPASGSRSVSPASTTYYTLTATNSAGSRTAQAIVTVEPVGGGGGNGGGNGGTNGDGGGGTNWGLYLLIGLLVVAAAVIAVLLTRRRTAVQPVSTTEPPTTARPTQPATATRSTTTIAPTAMAPTEPVVAAPPAALVMPNGYEIPLAGGTKTLGRRDFKEFVPSDKIVYVSKNHLTIGFEGGHYYIEDQGSANGTRLNGKEIRGRGRQWLRDGDRINVADAVDFTFETQ